MPAEKFTIEDARDLADDGPTKATLRAVAQTYQLAYAKHEHPIKAVEERFGLPRATAGRWVVKARLRGFLGAAHPGVGKGRRLVASIGKRTVGGSRATT